VGCERYINAKCKDAKDTSMRNVNNQLISIQTIRENQPKAPIAWGYTDKSEAKGVLLLIALQECPQTRSYVQQPVNNTTL
jgi:hypothetical protein